MWRPWACRGETVNPGPQFPRIYQSAATFSDAVQCCSLLDIPRRAPSTRQILTVGIEQTQVAFHPNSTLSSSCPTRPRKAPSSCHLALGTLDTEMPRAPCLEEVRLRGPSEIVPCQKHEACSPNPSKPKSQVCEFPKNQGPFLRPQIVQRVSSAFSVCVCMYVCMYVCR